MIKRIISLAMSVLSLFLVLTSCSLQNSGADLQIPINNVEDKEITEQIDTQIINMYHFDTTIKNADFSSFGVYSTGDTDTELGDNNYPTLADFGYLNKQIEKDVDPMTICIFDQTIVGEYKYTERTPAYHINRSRFFENKDKKATFAIDTDGKITELEMLIPNTKYQGADLSLDECVSLVEETIGGSFDLSDYTLVTESYNTCYLISYIKYVSGIETTDHVSLFCWKNGDIGFIVASNFGLIDKNIEIKVTPEEIFRKEFRNHEYDENGCHYKVDYHLVDALLTPIDKETVGMILTVREDETREYTDEKGEKVTEDILHEAIELIVIPE